MSNATGDESGETTYLHNNDGKDDNGDDSAGETSYLTNNGKGPDLDDRRPATGGGASGPDLGGSAIAAAAPVPAWIACWGTFWGN